MGRWSFIGNSGSDGVSSLRGSSDFTAAHRIRAGEVDDRASGC